MGICVIMGINCFSTMIKTNKQHVFENISLFKDVIQYEQYAMTHILQKRTILWTERKQPFVMHSITFSLI